MTISKHFSGIFVVFVSNADPESEKDNGNSQLTEQRSETAMMMMRECTFHIFLLHAGRKLCYF